MPIIDANKVSMAQIYALNKEGEKPANQTNKNKATILIINDIFFRLIFFPKNIAIDENIERCMPDKASI